MMDLVIALGLVGLAILILDHMDPPRPKPSSVVA